MRNKNINILTHSIIILFLLIHLNVRADEIHLKDGKILTGKIQSVSPDEINYIPEKEKKKKEVSISNAVKIKYDDGTVVKFAENEGGSFLDGDARLSQGKQSPFIFEDKTEPFLLPFMLRLGLMMNKGRTKVKIYDKNEKQIADGDADFDQYLRNITSTSTTEIAITTAEPVTFSRCYKYTLNLLPEDYFLEDDINYLPVKFSENQSGTIGK